MNRNLPDRSLIREYLLGRLDNKKEVEEQLSHDILFDDQLSEMVESIEDEIIEDLMHGRLDSAEKDAVNEYFLRPPERVEKLRFAQLLRHRFEERHGLAEATPATLPSADRHAIQEKFDRGSPIPWLSHFRTYGLTAALVLLSVGSLIYIAGRKDQTRLQAQLAQERERSFSLIRQAQTLQSSLVPLTLVSDRSRGDDTQIPNIEIKPSTQRIIVEIALHGHSPGPYDVQLETAGQKASIWSARLLPLVSSSGDARLVFDLPVQGMESDVYSFLVSSPLPGSGRAKHYDFRLKVAQ
jgi:hypothetical protein